MSKTQKKIWKFLIQTFISVLTALAAALGTVSCVSV
ncbi:MULTISPECIES: smalltalk protein [unclassified Prevotella]|nr:MULTISPECIES: smalltalk protein [unclassified Prevotella]